MPSHQHPDGRWTHTFSASWLKDYATCPEKARRRYFGITPWSASEFTALGSAVHAGIEYAIRAKMGEANSADPAFVADAALNVLVDIEAQPNFVEGGKYNANERRRLMAQHLDTFVAKVLPELHPVAVEHEFDIALHTDTFRQVRLRGRIDYIDEQLGVIDWKTAGNPHKVWEAERWDVQSTAYLLALRHMGGWQDIPAAAMRYVVFVHDKELQTYSLERGQGHFDWMTRQALAAARHVEAGLPLWTMNDHGWWCSEKWCAAWSDCKGAILGEKVAA